MTLSEFGSKFFSRPNIPSPTAIYVFGDEDSADSWIENMYQGIDSSDYSLVMVLRSDMAMEYTVKQEWCEAEVQQFYAVEPDVIVAVVEPKGGGTSDKSKYENDKKI